MIFEKKYVLPALICLTLTQITLPYESCAAAFEDTPKIGESFGVQVKHDLTSDKDLIMIREAGFGLVRFDMPWASVERNKKNYDWKAYDNFLNRIKKHNLGAIIILRGGNEIYSGLVNVPPEKFWGHSRLPPSPSKDEDITAFADFAGRAVRRYDRAGIIWEIWNEPDWHFWVPAQDPLSYARLASATCRTIRKVSPDATVIGPAVSQLPGEYIRFRSSFITDFLKSSALDCVDAISLHPYRNKDQVPESVIDDYASVRSYMQKQLPSGKTLPPIVSSEWGYSGVFVSNDQQAGYALRSHLSNLLSGVPLSIWYEWKNSYQDEPGNKEAHFGLIDSSGTPKKSFEAVGHILPLIRDAVIEMRIETGNDDVFAVVIRYPDGRNALLIWSATKKEKRLIANLSWPAHTKLLEITLIPQLIETNGYIPKVVITAKEGKR